MGVMADHACRHVPDHRLHDRERYSPLTHEGYERMPQVMKSDSPENLERIPFLG